MLGQGDSPGHPAVTCAGDKGHAFIYQNPTFWNALRGGRNQIAPRTPPSQNPRSSVLCLYLEGGYSSLSTQKLHICSEDWGSPAPQSWRQALFHALTGSWQRPRCPDCGHCALSLSEHTEPGHDGEVALLVQVCNEASGLAEAPEGPGVHGETQHHFLLNIWPSTHQK